MSENEVATIDSLNAKVFTDALPIILRSRRYQFLRPEDKLIIDEAAQELESLGRTYGQFIERVEPAVRHKLSMIACCVNPHLRQRPKLKVEESVFGFLRLMIGTLKDQGKDESARRMLIEFFRKVGNSVL